MLYWHMGYMGWWDILFWIAIIWLIFWLIKKNIATETKPLDTIKMRYARGELTKKEFEQLKKDMGG